MQALKNVSGGMLKVKMNTVCMCVKLKLQVHRKVFCLGLCWSIFSLLYGVHVFCEPLFCLLANVLSALLFTPSDCPFSIF
jgi:predicted metal-binding membrane protein